MKYIFLLAITISASFANILEIKSFEADFQQSITDEKGEVLKYSGHVNVSRPSYALWNYKAPVSKQIYVTGNRATIVEPELEQVIIKHIDSSLDFFSMLKNAKKLTKNSYEAHYKELKYMIKLKDEKIDSISYKDEFDNQTTIIFSKQYQNRKIDKKIFEPKYPLDYDTIEE